MESESGFVALRDLSTRITKGTTPPRGKGFVDHGINYIKSEAISPDGSIDTSKFAFIDEKTHLSFARSQLQVGNVLFSMAGVYLGKTSVVKAEHLPANTNQAVGIITLDGARADPYFIHYVLQSPRCRSWVARSAAQSAQPNFNLKEIGDLPIPNLPLHLQQDVSNTLKALDDRIDLLRQTNITLEAIAQALFKSWFVDFDPVHAKAEDREPEAMDAATAAMFPSEFEESELGPIPKGWDVETLGGAANVIDCLHAKKPELLDNGRPYLQLNCIRSDGLLDVSLAAAISDGDYEKWTSRIEARTGDCVITNVGRVGAVAQIPCNYLAAIGRNMTAVRCNSAFPYPTVLIELLTSEFMRHEIEQKTDAGTILAALNVKNIPKLRFVRGADEILQKFETLCRPLRAAMEQNLQRANLLASIRDALLPRLISGKLRLPDDAEANEAALA